MAKFKIETEVFFGISHCGALTENAEGFVELTEQDVNTLVELIKEHQTADVEELELEKRYPEIYNKLYDAYREISYPVYELHWLWFGFYEPDCDEYDNEELKEYCRQNCGFEFVYDEKDYMDDEGEINEDLLMEHENDAFDEWLIKYLEGLEPDEAIEFFYDHMNADLDGEMNGTEFEVQIPREIVDMANLEKD